MISYSRVHGESKIFQHLCGNSGTSKWSMFPHQPAAKSSPSQQQPIGLMCCCLNLQPLRRELCSPSEASCRLEWVGSFPSFAMFPLPPLSTSFLAFAAAFYQAWVGGPAAFLSPTGLDPVVWPRHWNARALAACVHRSRVFHQASNLRVLSWLGLRL